MNVRRMVKSFAEILLGAETVVHTALARLTGARLILSYHNVIADDTAISKGDASLHLPLRQFRSQLDDIARLGLRVAPIDEPQSPRGAPTVVITFDDAYAGTVDHALPELSARELPSTVFVAPGLLGCSGPWWDQLASPETGAIPTAIRDAALDELAGQETRILEEAHRRGWRLTEPLDAHRIADEAALDEVVRKHPLVSFGAHTWTHPNLAQLTDEELANELIRPRGWLMNRFGPRYVDWLAYPYGRSSEATASAAASAGYRGAVLVTGGWDRGQASAWATPRLNVTPGISVAGFRARLAGLL